MTGEIATLPLVVLVSFLAQPRLQYAMATDGLLPEIFSDVDKKGNFVKGIIISGLICVLIALFVPFKYLDDMISAGVLVSFNLTNASLIIIRRCDSSNPVPCTLALIIFNVLSILFHILLVNITFSGTFVLFSVEMFTVSMLVVMLLLNAIYIHTRCPENEDPEAVNQFRVPGLPFVPLFGIFVNYLLLAQLSVTGILMIFGYFGLAGVFYFGYGIHHSKGNNTGWREILDETSDQSNRKYGNIGMVEGVASLNGEKQIEYTFQSTFRKSLHDDSDISTDYSNGNNNSNNGNNGNNSNRKNLKIEKISTSITADNGHGTAASHAGKRKVCPGSYALLSTSNDHNSDDDTRNESDVQNVSTHLRKVF
jgi:amino acid permease